MGEEEQLHMAWIGPGEHSRMIEAWGEALERKDPGTWGHCKRVGAMATILAQALGLADEEIRAIADGALLHEVGKLAIPDAILLKPTTLTHEERLVMRDSCSRGYEMLHEVSSLAEAAEIVYAQREKFDGTGYPRGLKGTVIPLGARIVAVANAFDMFISDRPQQWARGFAAARREILGWSGRELDPQIVEVALSVLDDAKVEGVFGALY